MEPRQQLVTLLAERSARRGHFVLSSGRTSNLYIDARLTTMSPEGLALIGPLGLATVQRTFGADVDAIGGLTLGADPIAYAISYASAATHHPLRAFTVRKEAKAHGEALGADEIALTRAALGWTHEPFVIPEGVYADWDAKAEGAKLQASWAERLAAYAKEHPALAAEDWASVVVELAGATQQVVNA